VSLIEILDPAFKKAKLDFVDVSLSTRLAEATFTGRWDSGVFGFDGTTARKLKTDTAGELQIDVLTVPITKGDWLSAIPNPANLDVLLSTRLADTKIPNALAQISKDISGSAVYALASIPSGSPMDMTRDPAYTEIAVSTTEGSTAFAAPGLKIFSLISRGDNDMKVRYNSATGAQRTIKARCGVIEVFGGLTTLYSVTVAGTSTLVVRGLN